MNKENLERFIKIWVDKIKVDYPKQVMKNFQVKVYNMSFGNLQVVISSDYGKETEILTRYYYAERLISEFFRHATFRLYEEYWNKHHKKARK